MDDVISLQHGFRKSRELINKINNHKIPASVTVRDKGRRTKISSSLTCHVVPSLILKYRSHSYIPRFLSVGSLKFDIHHVIDHGAITWKQFEKIVDILIASNPLLSRNEEYRKLSNQLRVITYKMSKDNDEEFIIVDSTESLIKALEHYFESFVVLDHSPNEDDSKSSDDEKTQQSSATDAIAAAEGMIFEILYVAALPGTFESLPSSPATCDALLEGFGAVKDSAVLDDFGAMKDSASSTGDEENDSFGSAGGNTGPHQNGETGQFYETTTEDIRVLIDEVIQQHQKQMPWWEYTLLKAKYALIRASSIVAGSGNNPGSRGNNPPTAEKALSEECKYILLAIGAASVVTLIRKIRPESSVIFSWRPNCRGTCYVQSSRSC